MTGGSGITRVLLFTGKGGVGKTTAAAATAVRCADAGLRTMVLSTDPAHSLADAFDVPMGSIGTPVGDHLWGQQLDAQERFEDSWDDIQSWLRDVFNWSGLDAIEAEELALLPGLEEVFALADLKAYVDSGDWDVVVVDCGPTAETIRLLSLPEILDWYMTRVFPLGRKVNRVLGPVVARMSSLPVAGDQVFRSAQRFYDRLAGVRELLTDPVTTSVRLVVNPEQVVIAESRRTYTYLSLFGYHTDAVIANRLLPAAVDDPWFDSWRARQAEHLATLEEGFGPLPVLTAALARTEVVGVDALREFGAGLYGDRVAHEPQHRGEAMAVSREGQEWVLRLPLPFTERDEVELRRAGSELLVRVGPYRRALVLPDSLRRRAVTAARFHAGSLEVRFATAGDASEVDGLPARVHRAGGA